MPTIVPFVREKVQEKAICFTSLLKDMKILVATEKPFAKKAVEGIRQIVEEAGYELALLEKYTDKAKLLAAVAAVDALIIRSDKVTAEVIDAAKNLKIPCFFSKKTLDKKEFALYNNRAFDCKV